MFRRTVALLIAVSMSAGVVEVGAAPPEPSPTPSGTADAAAPADPQDGRPTSGDSPAPVAAMPIATEGEPQVQTADLLAKGLAGEQLPTVDAGVSTVGVPADRGVPVRVAGAPLSVGRAPLGDDRVELRSPDAVRVTLVDSKTAESLGLVGFGFQLEAAADATSVEVAIDYAGFESLYGADFAGRLQLVRYPACVLTDRKNPECSTPEVIKGATNDRDSRTVTAVADVSYDATVRLDEPAATDVPAVPESPGSAPASPADTSASVPSTDNPSSTSTPATTSTPTTSSSTTPTATTTTSTTVTTTVTTVTTDSTAVVTAGFGRGWRASGSGGSVYGLENGFSSDFGSFTATPLSASASWDVGLQMGSFEYSYPVPVPPTGFGAAPSVGLSYSSSAVDGVVSDENTQNGLLGAGWTLAVGGFIERTYKPCNQDGWGINDFCWMSDNATIVLDGHATEMYYTGVASPDGVWTEWRLKDNPGWKVVRSRYAESNPWDNLGEVWYVYTPDGSEYRFGKRYIDNTGEATQATWHVPVYGNHPGEPCYNTDPTLAWCHQAWRWNLDRVKDRYGNIQLFKYSAEVNSYGRHGGPANATPYVRGGWLTEIRYGARAGTEGTYRDKVVFNTAARCFSAGTGGCAWYAAISGEWYPDSPTDLRCSTSWCPKLAPSFWTERALTSVDTWSGLGTSPVRADRIALVFDWPDPNGALGGEPAQLWLRTITRTGVPDGGSITLPSIQFDSYSSLRDNRADGITMRLWRIDAVADELGGLTSVVYTTQGTCNVPGSWETNTQTCFPRWTSVGGAVGWGQFSTYQVLSVTRSDQVTGKTPVTTYYNYDWSTPVYHYDDSPYTTIKAYSEPRGWQRVDTWTGSGAHVRHFFFRGMNGDYVASTGGTRSVTVSYGDGTTVADENWLRGREYRTEVWDASANGVTMESRDETWFSPYTTSSWSGLLTRRIDVTKTRHQVRTTSAGYSTYETRYVNDSYGFPVETWDLGDTSVSTDDTCTATSYARNSAATDAWLVELVVRTITAKGNNSFPGGEANNCDETAGQELARVDTYYDNNGHGVASPTGFVTVVSARPSATSAMQSVVYTGDAAGHVLTVDGPLVGTADTTTYAYTTSDGFRYRTTDATGHTIEQSIDLTRGSVLSSTDWNNRTVAPAFDGNDKTTVFGYDALGRFLGVRLPGESDANVIYNYSVTKTSPSMIATATRIDNTNFVYSYTYYDGLGRVHETQTSGVNGGRVISGVDYDDRSNPYRSYQDRYTTGTPGSGLVTTWGAYNPTLAAFETRATFDFMNRQTSSARYSNNAAVVTNGVAEQTITEYYPDMIRTWPPTGSKTEAYINGRGQTTILREYNTTWTGGKDTTYVYDVRGRLVSTTDPKGNVTAAAYDNFGRQYSATDRDRGTVTTSYNLDSTIATVTDANSTLWFGTDVLGRTTEIRNASSGGTLLEKYVYDATGEAGLLDYAASYYQGAELRIDTTGYDARNRPAGYTYTIPSITGLTDTNGLAGSSTFTIPSYRADGQPNSFGYPASGGLPAETVSYGYTTTGRPTTLTSGNITLVGATSYTDLGRLSTRTYDATTAANRILRSYGWDPNTGRLTSMTAVQSGTTTIQDEQFAYDANGNLIANRHDRPGSTDDHRECYGYDGRNHLTSAYTTTNLTTCAGYVAGGPGAYSTSYAIDEIGNFTTGPAGTYTYPASGWNSTRPHAPTTAGANSFTWNPDGTMATKTTSGVTSTYAWDQFDRLRSVTKGADVTTMIYYPGGQRALMKDSVGVHLYFDSYGERHATTGASAPTTIATKTFDSTTDGMTGWYNATTSVSTTTKRTGASALKVTATDAWQGVVDANMQTVVPGTNYNFTVYAKAATAGASIKIVARWFDSSWTQLGYTWANPGGTDTTTTWTPITASIIAPPGATMVLFGLQIDDPSSTAVHYFDDYTLTTSTVTTTTIAAKGFETGRTT
jgi:YD repeat-containing protein